MEREAEEDIKARESLRKKQVLTIASPLFAAREGPPWGHVFPLCVLKHYFALCHLYVAPSRQERMTEKAARRGGGSR